MEIYDCRIKRRPPRAATRTLNSKIWVRKGSNRHFGPWGDYLGGRKRDPTDRNPTWSSRISHAYNAYALPYGRLWPKNWYSSSMHRQTAVYSVMLPWKIEWNFFGTEILKFLGTISLSSGWREHTVSYRAAHHIIICMQHATTCYYISYNLFYL